MISNLYPPVAVGGYETRCAHTVEWLGRRHETLVLTSRRGRRGLPKDPRVSRRLAFLPQNAWGALRAPWASLQAARIVRRTLSVFKPELVFVWNASQIPRAVVWIAQDSGVPVAFSLADPWLGSFVEGDQFLRHLAPGDRGLRRVWAALVRLVNRLAPLRLGLSGSRPAAIVWNSKALRELTAVPSQIVPVLERVIHPASRNEALFEALRRSPAATPTVAFVGRIEWEKAPDVACRAVALMRDRHGVDARLVLVGSGADGERRALRALVRRLAIEDRVELTGPLAPRGVAGVLARAHALVVPSRWQEPFGLVCLEAALARVPVVASFSGGMPEMLVPEREALFFPIDDAEACAAALVRTIQDAQATADRTERAFTRVQGYSLERYRKAYDVFVDDAVHACLQTRARADQEARVEP
ncbi:MAG TPA: glycosyltransferase [Solirubrobacteraceae bacterium]|nr:glycosyltransferase [Solirubrobacteraceae bacterium]